MGLRTSKGRRSRRTRCLLRILGPRSTPRWAFPPRRSSAQTASQAASARATRSESFLPKEETTRIRRTTLHEQRRARRDRENQNNPSVLHRGRRSHWFCRPGSSGSDCAAPGAAVADFSLKDIHRRPRSLGAFKDKKAFVVVFLGTECPLANLYLPTLIELHKAYAGKGVQFLAINSNVQDSFIEVSAHAQERDVPFPVLKDFDHQRGRRVRRQADARGVPARRRSASSATTAASTTSTASATSARSRRRHDLREAPRRAAGRQAGQHARRPKSPAASSAAPASRASTAR